MSEKTIQLPIGQYPKMQEFFNNPAQYKLMQKGRRVGGTENMINHIIELMVSGKTMRILWIDTTYRMLWVYWKKFWIKKINPLPRSLWEFNKTSMTLECMGSTLFFKSYDNIESIEGDNYDLICVNECGFLLKESHLWEQTLAPMLLDSNGKAIFVGTPKSGKNSYHYEIIKKIQEGKLQDWYLEKFTTFDNPYIPKSAIEKYIESIDPEIAQTEVYGEFPDASLSNFFYQFRFEKHVCNIQESLTTPLYLSFDFNVNPMTAIAFKVLRNGVEVLKEYYLENASIYDMCAKIRQQIPNIIAITGDASGASRSGNVINLASFYDTILSELRLKKSQLKVTKRNPSIENSRILCNAILFRGDIKINATCKHLIEDLLTLQIKPSGDIDKSNSKLSHLADCFRYALNAFCPDFIKELN